MMLQRYLKPILITLAVCLVLFGIFYYFTQQHNYLQQQISELVSKKSAPFKVAVNEQLGTVSGVNNWLAVQKKVKDTVVQVYAQTVEFNWLEPYRSPEQGEGTGSGFFINEQGDLITNYHVVAQASSIQIQIPTFGMERFDMEIVGVSPERDIALLKTTKESKEKIRSRLKKIPYLKLGDSDQVLRSQEVLALGYPLGQTRLKSTLGIVSGRERLGYFGYIQITAPLNPGNSGGPALNANGDVIGINSRGVMEAQNVGYIIPINEVTSALKDLHKVKLLRKPTLGCIFTIATPDLVKFLGNPADGGWYIAKVFNNTLLESVGVKDEDMLYEINGHKIDMYGELNVPWSEDKVSLFELLNRFTVGDMIHFIVYRKGKRIEFKFKLEHKYLPSVRSVYPEFEQETTDYENLGGMVVMELTMNHIALLLSRAPDLVRYSKPELQHEPGLIITHIFPNSQASKARVLRRGEVIEEINGEKVKTLKDFRNVVLKSKKTGFITIRTYDNLYAALSVEKILKEEELLTMRYFFKKSELIDLLGPEKSPDTISNPVKKVKQVALT